MGASSGFPNPWTGTTLQSGFMQHQTGIGFSYLVDQINYLTSLAKSKIAMIPSQKSSMSIADMFDLQMSMNQLSQFSEMSTSVISGMNSAIGSMARNVKS